ncbi:MAG TPA: tRNA uracil 4-sulfurtransferase ThiI [Bacillus sp. (in: firmicutes)]|uniref:tRNA uracil 4-sulfurtransferase ThiI n=1 Tax=Bacillus litorisediminis TaxID=2922713 RepID=UPI001FAC04A1|nr:tRNA uracil 4-sulfurtransferase ThiI [Bacillus litorisediminis]HWO75470.1 tRNA uracil 4-sulfurtransferase ThiI [Bacillus sp. (in: firmicutes)]
MKYDRILIRYGELSTKGRNRKAFISQLKHNIGWAFQDFEGIKIEANRDRAHILLNGTNEKAVIQRLKGIFGIQSFSPVLKVAKNVEAIQNGVLELLREHSNPNETFKITTKRADKEFPHDTNEMNHLLGGHILKSGIGLKVDVHKPDHNVLVEIRKEAVYISVSVIPGAGGLPVGSSGKAMLMLSGGIDSPVAGYLSMKRGVEVEAVHFHSPPYTSERAKQKVMDLAKVLSTVSGKIKVHIVPFTKIQETIQAQVPENVTMTSTRRFMLKITDQIREKSKGLAIITGESLGQVASQTLESMYAINSVTSTPVLRPLLAMDKTEIMNIARDIGTYDISNRPYEDCCTIFTPSMPKTKPKKEKVEHYESYVDFTDLIEEAIQNTETFIITPEDKSADEEVNSLF